MHVRIGLAALSNVHFDNALVPIGTRHAAYMPRYATIFDAFELAQLYHDAEPTDEAAAWAAQAGVRFSAKLHKAAVAPGAGARPWDEGRKEWDEAALDAAAAARAKWASLASAARLWGPVVAQFPPRFHRTPGNERWLRALLGGFGAGELAVELRDASWWHRDVERLLKDHAAPLVWSTHDAATSPPWVTGKIGYIRLTGNVRPHRGRPVTVRDRLGAILDLRARLAGAPWDEAVAIVTNGFEGNAVDSLPRVAAALGRMDIAKACTREPGRPLLADPESP